jgi:hypothetical protein
MSSGSCYPVTPLRPAGPTPEMLLRQLLHVVVDNQGNIKADVVKNNVTCR